MNNNNITFRSKSNNNLTQSNSSTSLNNNSINNTTTTTLSPTIIPYIHQSKSNNELSSPYSSSSFHINNHQINDIEMDTFHTIDNNNLINLSSDDHFLHNSSFQKDSIDSMKLSLTSNDYIKNNNNSDNNSSITNKNTHHKKSHHHNSESHRNSIESIRSNYSINGKDKLIIKSPTITTTKQKKIEIAKKIGKMVYTIFLLIILIILIVLDVITSPKNTWISRGSIVIAVVLFGRFLYEFLFEFIYEYILDHYLSDDLSNNIVLDNNKV